MRILRPDSGLKLLTPTAEKLRLLEKTGIDAVAVISFTRDLSLMSPRDFVKHILSDKLRALEVHEGYNFRFGHKAAGDVNLLKQLGTEFGFEVVAYPEMRLRGESVSSTRIRELIQMGDYSPRAFSARTSIQCSINCGAGARLRIEVHGAYDKSQPLRRIGGARRSVRHADSRGAGML